MDIPAHFDFPTNSLTLPPLVLGPVRYSIGEAYQILRLGQTHAIVGEKAVSISARINARGIELDNQEWLVVTDRSKLELPDKVDGAIRRVGKNDFQWLAHRRLSEAQSIAQSGNLSSLAKQSATSWKNDFRYRNSEPGQDGLRPPQLGALFAVGMHWSLFTQPATIVMPTGTGKTETMLAVLAAHQISRCVVAVPTKALRDQTADKFKTFGLLRRLGVLTSATNPVVGIALRRPKSEDELQLFRECNVVVGAVSSLAAGTAEEFLPRIAQMSDLLVVDEAHHVAAATWTNLRSAFEQQGKRVLQFTATPFRDDGRLVEGKVIYSYPLKAAQQDGYFRKIEFLPIQELNEDIADKRIAEAAVGQLRKDLERKHNHLLMARCRTVERATTVFEIYQRLAPEFSPLLIHSDISVADERVALLRSQSSRIVVCVNMLGEGVDIPQLKIAAIHDLHQSLAVLLQFVGRFTRTSVDKELGDATVIANIANPKIVTALEQLYCEDADWNDILREMSSSAAQEHAEFIRFLHNSVPFEVPGSMDVGISSQSLRPTFSSLFFEAAEFRPKRFIEGLPDNHVLVRGWINENANTLFFVTRTIDRVKWTQSKEVEHVMWHLFVLHHDQETGLLCLASSDKESNFEAIAKAVGASQQLSGENIFRAFGRIGRLVFNNLGVTKHGRRNLSYAMYTGADVRSALSESEKTGSRKSNIQGHGWEDGRQTTIGASYKGRVWSKNAGTIPKFIKWAETSAGKLVDSTIDTKSIIANVLIPQVVEQLPECEVLNIDWPLQLLAKSEDSVRVLLGERKHEMLKLDLKFRGIDRKGKSVEFAITAGDDEELIGEFQLRIYGDTGYEIIEQSDKRAQIQIGKRLKPLRDYLQDYPPLVRFVDLSELDGNLILRSENPEDTSLAEERLVPWDWAGVDITRESIWRHSERRDKTVQERVATQLAVDGYSIVFDDDGASEAADLICWKLESDHIRLALVHCKYSGDDAPGERISDVQEVAAQAVRSARWPGRLPALIRHMQNRSGRRGSDAAFLTGTAQDLMAVNRAVRVMEVRPEVLIVQPGVSKRNITAQQSMVLGAALSYLKQTIEVDADIICSA